MNQLTGKQLASLKHELHRLSVELQQQLERGAESAAPVELDQTLVGRVSRMDAMQQQSVALSTRQHTQCRLDKIRAALKSMADDDYGYCRRCDDAIGFPRLQAQPETRLCIHCQNSADNQ